MSRFAVTLSALFLALPILPCSAGSDTPPPSFDVAARQPVLTLQGVGAQLYQCTAKPDGTHAWTFREPIAVLLDGGKTVGRHYGGPTWDVGESGVTGKAAANAPGATADDVPLLRLEVTGHHGVGGPLAEVTTVLRLRTSGGVLAGACEPVEAFQAVPYRADYVFLK